MEDLLDDFCTFFIAGSWRGLSDNVVDKLMFFLGYDTTANLLQFAIVLVHQHPEVLSRYVSCSLCELK